MGAIKNGSLKQFYIFFKLHLEKPKEPEIKVRPNETLLKEAKTKKILNREPNLVGRAIKKIAGEIDQVSISPTFYEQTNSTCLRLIIAVNHRVDEYCKQGQAKVGVTQELRNKHQLQLLPLIYNSCSVVIFATSLYLQFVFVIF